MTQEGWDAIEEFVTGHLMPPDAVLAEVTRACTGAGLPAIQVSAVEGRFLNLLARMQGARRILEVGTLGGYSSIWLARALPPDGALVTLELDPAHAAVARANFARAGLTDVIDLREGPALESLSALAAASAAPFDFVFLDADKEHHPDYFEWALKLTRPGSVIVADNVVRKGEIIDPENHEVHIAGIRRLFANLSADPRVEATAIQTVGSKGHDGFLLARVTGSPPPSPPLQSAPSSTPTGS